MFPFVPRADNTHQCFAASSCQGLREGADRSCWANLAQAPDCGAAPFRTSYWARHVAPTFGAINPVAMRAAAGTTATPLVQIAL